MSMTPQEQANEAAAMTNTPQPEADAVASPPPSSEAATSVPQAPAVQSSGIGLTRGEWEAAHGVGEKGVVGSYYEQRKYDVAYTDEGFANSIWVYYRTGAVDLETARAESRTLLPQDAQPVGNSQVIPDDGGEVTYIVDTYKSEAVIPLYKPVKVGELTFDPWNEGEPGTLHVMFKRFKSMGDKVEVFVVNVGKFDRP